MLLSPAHAGPSVEDAPVPLVVCPVPLHPPGSRLAPSGRRSWAPPSSLGPHKAVKWWFSKCEAGPAHLHGQEREAVLGRTPDLLNQKLGVQPGGV